MDKSSEELLRGRQRRFEDTVRLRVPDRVPFLPSLSFFPAKYAGISFADYMYNYDLFFQSLKQFYIDFQPDMYTDYSGVIAIGSILEALDYKQLRWPGHGFHRESGYQFIETEYMKSEEYEQFNNDPSGFILRTFFPRVYGAFEPFSILPPMPWMHHFTRTATSLAPLGSERFAGSLKALTRAANEAQKLISKATQFHNDMLQLGFPCERRSAVYAPFDYFGDCLRGTNGILLDIYRNPDRLVEAMEKVLPILSQQAIASTRATGNPVVFIPLHKGSDEFMSANHFKTFYWPTLQKLLINLIDQGAIPCAFFEGNYTSRLEIIGDIPGGKAIYRFGTTDIFKAKEILGRHICIRGNVPASLLCTGTVADVREYCEKLLKYVGKGGGFIMDGGAGIPDQARVENVKAMADTTLKYGGYN